jgi:chemotaxis-related protein WspD
MSISISLPVMKPANDCWNRIGVNGDRTCPELEVHVHCRNCPVFAGAARGFFDRRAPEGYLAEWSELLGRPAEGGSSDDSSLLVFRLGGEWLALSLSVIAEVTAPRPVHRVPHRSNRVFTGLVSLRGQLQFCVSLHGLLDVTPTDPVVDPSTAPRLVVIRQGLETWAFPAEEVSGVHRVPRDQLLKVPSTLANPLGSFGRAVFERLDGRSVDVLDEPRVFEALRRMGT